MLKISRTTASEIAVKMKMKSLLGVSMIVVSVYVTACGGGSSPAPNADSSIGDQADENTTPPPMMDTTPITPVNMPVGGGASGLADVQGGRFNPDGGNSAILNGMVIGTDPNPNPDVARALPFTVEDNSENFAVRSVYSMNGGDDILMVVENLTDKVLCTGGGLLPTKIELHDSAGNIYETALSALGSLLKANQNGGATSWCSMPRSLMYVRGRPSRGTLIRAVIKETDPIFLLDENFNQSVSNGEAYTLPAVEKIVPISYTLTDSSEPDLAVTFVNQSNENVQLLEFYSIALDASGFPVGVGTGYATLNPLTGDIPTILPGGEITLTSDMPVSGAISSVRAIAKIVLIGDAQIEDLVTEAIGEGQ